MNDLKIAIIGGLVGSVFTFAVTRFSDFLNRIRERNARHYTALVRLEHALTEYGGVIDDNRQSIETILIAFSNKGALPLNRLATVSTDKSIQYDLHNLELINDVFSFENDLRRMNDDSTNINFHLNSFQNAVLNKTVSIEEYEALVSNLKEGIGMLRAFLIEFLDNIVELTAKARIRMAHDATWTTKLLRWSVDLNKKIITEGQLRKIKIKVLGEIEENRKKSLERKRKIHETFADND